MRCVCCNIPLDRVPERVVNGVRLQDCFCSECRRISDEPGVLLETRPITHQFAKTGITKIVNPTY